MEAITREEKLMSGQQLEPITRKELFLAKASGMDVKTPEPITREEMFLSKISGGGSSPVVEPLSVTENGTYTAPDGVDGYNPVTVNVESGDIPAHGVVYTSVVYGYPAGTLSIYGTVGVETVINGQYIKSVDCKNAKRLFGKIMLDNNNAYTVLFPPDFTTANNQALYNFGAGSEITFAGKPTSIDSNAFQTSKIITINVPWAEGEVSGAPWGATNATINYNYTGG